MAKLILSLDGMVIREYPLTKERTTLGRKPHNDIVIDNLAISGEHAMIMTILNDSFLEDLVSTKGTHVNGQPIKKHFLQNNTALTRQIQAEYVTDHTGTTSQLTLKKQWSCGLLLAVRRPSRVRWSCCASRAKLRRHGGQS
jgi:hypothetical protein